MPTSSARPVILTVDDDPGVSRSIARDLRRRYGEENRIVRAEAPDQALDALRELKLRGEPVAVLLADYRMPGMSGIDFLENAIELFPLARRVLLTAYADTDAAIQAINVVDLDHYLLKPWNPPEEKLYPVVDAMIDLWKSTPEQSSDETRVIGHRWSAPSFQARDFLARNAVPYRWLGVDDDESRRLLEAAGIDGSTLPVIITPDGTVLVKPSDSELADKVGLSTHPAEEFYDLVVVGGGPAGLGAAVYGASEGLRTVLVEEVATGGQAGQSSRIENYLGFPDGVSGAQLTDRARRQAVRFGAELLTARQVVGLETLGSARRLRFSDGSEISAHSVILATGVSYRSLEAPGVDDLCGKGIYYGSATTEGPSCAGQQVYIIGGANSAGQAAVYFSKHAKRVHMLVRGPSLEATMSSYLIDQIDGIGNIEVHTCTQVVSCKGSEHLERVTLTNSATGESREVDTEWMFVFIGAAPRTDWLPGDLLRDDRGFVLTGPDLHGKPAGWALEREPYHLETSMPGVFAAGDVRAESVKRVASAVGDGAMAVTLVHRYLEML
ncbi:response regulator [Kribbella alba]|uniref:Response regulator n=1 Tax=Kribbella alba TaxID=190197 RepID=A0ABP4RL44_9ACTN